ncbi:30391_t:CDS:2, partial [Gigaspora margarita]
GAKKFGSNALELLKSALQNCYSNKDYISMKAIDYSVNNYNFHIDFEKENLLQTKQHQLAIVQALNKTQVLREGYQQIATVNSTIPREDAIFIERVLLNNQMEANIRITQVNLYYLEVEKDFTNAIEQGMIDKIDKIRAQRSIKDLLNYIIPYLNKLILNWNNMNGHIRAPLFDMILFENWICDELHVLLRIYDRLWELIIAELKAHGLYNDKSQKIIVDEMKKINVTFQFWEIMKLIIEIILL